MQFLLEHAPDLAGFLIRCSGLVLVLFVVSRFPAFRTLFYRRELDRRGQIWYVLFWTIASLLAPQLTVASAFVPFFAGLFSDVRLGGTVGLAAAVWILVRGGSWPAAVGHVLAGLVGGRSGRRLGPGRRPPARLALLAGLLSILGLDAPDHPGIWAPLALLFNGPQGWLMQIPYLMLGFSLTSFAFMRLMEYLLTEGERDRARTADRVLTLVGELERSLAPGLTLEAARELAARVQQVLEVPACFVACGTDGLAFAGALPHDGFLVGARSGDHRAVFAGCPPGCPYTRAHLVPLQDVGVLGLLETVSVVLPPSTAETLQGLGTLLSGHLAAARVQQQKSALESARFRFLQAQIQPHFLFNALNTVAALTTRDPAVARDVVLNLSRVLRESFRQDRSQISLAEELEVVQAYLTVERARFGDRLRVTLDVPDPLPAASIPPFTLQPLLENAVRHGIGPQVEGGEVRLRIREEGGQLLIEIEDSGAGMSASRLAEVLERNADGIGVSNVRERLATVYREAAQFTLVSEPGNGTRVTVKVPCCRS